MSYAPTRRQILQGGSALLAAATLGLIRPNSAFAAHDKITVRVERDLGNLDPANRTGPLDKNRQQSDSEKDRKFLYRPGLVILYLGRDASKLGWDNASAAERERAAAFPRNPDDPSGISCSGPPVKTRLSTTVRGCGNRDLKHRMPQSSIQGEPI